MSFVTKILSDAFFLARGGLSPSGKYKSSLKSQAKCKLERKNIKNKRKNPKKNQQ